MITSNKKETDHWPAALKQRDNERSFPIKTEFQAEHERRGCENLATLTESLKRVHDESKSSLFNLAQMQNAVVP